MSFYYHFNRKCIPEWKEYYLSYKLFQSLFDPFKKTSDIFSRLVDSKIQLHQKMYSIDSNDVLEEIDQLKIFEEKFVNLIKIEIEKIDSFFQLKFLEFIGEWEKLKENALAFKPIKVIKKFERKGKILKNAFHLFYIKVNYLIQYVNLNYDALSRVLRKHRKFTFNYSKRMQVSNFRMEQLMRDRYITRNSDSLMQLRDDLTSTYLDLFYHRYSKNKGIKELQSLMKTRVISIWSSRFLFIFLGFSICLLIFILIMAIDGSIDPDDNETFKYIFPMFRGSAFIVLYIWFLGWNVYTWTKNHINYKKIFEFNYHYSTPTEILMRGTFFSSILFIIFIWYITVKEDMGSFARGLDSIGIPKEYLPLVLWVLLLVYIFFPSRKWFNGDGRRYFLIRLYRYLISPIVTIDVPTAWVADQIMSFVIPLQDFAYTICYYSSRIRNYDNMHPGHCFADTIYVGFLVGFFPGVFRTIHFLHFVNIGQKKINEKRKEINDFKKNDGDHHNINNQSRNLNPNENLTVDNLNENINNEKDLSLKSSKAESEITVDYTSKLKKDQNEMKNDEVLNEKMKELTKLTETRLLNIMYAFEQSLAPIVTTFSFLCAKYPEENVYFGFWILAAFTLSTYAFYMDVTRDWLLGQKNSKNPYLRDKLGYSNKFLYYMAIILNFFLRYVWVFSISPGTSSNVMRPEFFIFLMGGFEMFRRVIWNFLVIEKVFITNLENYRGLYEYELPFSGEEADRMIEAGKLINGGEWKNGKITVQSLDYEDDFKVKFRKNGNSELEKGLLKEAEGEIVMNVDGEKEENYEAEKDSKKYSIEIMDLVEKLKENINKAKEKIEEFSVIEEEAKNYEENIKKRYVFSKEIIKK